MWDSADKGPCNICEYSRSKKMVHFDGMQEDSPYLEKENMQTFSPSKADELSMYETNSPLAFVENSPSHCSHANRRPLEDHDTNSQDSGYGASYNGENGKFLSHASPTATKSFGSNSLCSMEDEYLDFSDVEPLEKGLPHDFNKLIHDPLALGRAKPSERTSPKDMIIRPLFRRALSLQCTNTKVTPISTRIRTSLFKCGESEMRCFKRAEPPSASKTSTGIKRSRIFEEEEASVPEASPSLHRVLSATEESIMCALQRSSTEPDLIGDFSKNFSLPLTTSRHQDLKAITPATLAELMSGHFSDTIASFKVIDCRYPYEFDGGHINGAINIYTKEQCIELLNTELLPNSNLQKRHILVFHCEFSSERGPNLYRYLRKEDRQKNENVYPYLFYPEIYLLEGGYKNFFQHHAEMCVPIAYKEMLHPDHENDLRYFRQKSRTWNCDSRRSHNGKNWKRLGLN